MICWILLFWGISVSATVVDPERTLSGLREICIQKKDTMQMRGKPIIDHQPMLAS